MSDQDENAVRAEVKEWLSGNWNPGASLIEWRTLLADSGWGMPDWPVDWYGKDYPPLLAAAVNEEFIRIL